MRKCIFFDRDGIVNRSPGPGYVERLEDFHLIPEFVGVLKTVLDLGYVAVLITNQQGVAKGIVSAAEVDRIHGQLMKVLKEEHGLELLDIFVCPHKDGTCKCRKPMPGMLLQAAQKHGIDLSQSWMIGDHTKDVEAGKRAGCRTVFVGTGAPKTVPDRQVGDMAELQRQIAKILALG